MRIRRRLKERMTLPSFKPPLIREEDIHRLANCVVVILRFRPKRVIIEAIIHSPIERAEDHSLGASCHLPTRQT